MSMVGGAKPNDAATGGAAGITGGAISAGGAGATVSLGIDGSGSATGVSGNSGTEVLVGADDAVSMA